METWAILVLVIGLNIITVLSSYFLTKMQVRHSDARLEKQLQSARETDSRQRKREVRGEPLLKLRAELAIMATKRDRLLASRDRAQASARKQHIDMTEEGAKRELQEAENDWNTYRSSENLPQILFLQYDTELRNKVEEIRRDSWFDIHAREVRERNKARVIEVQSLITKLLEEL